MKWWKQKRREPPAPVVQVRRGEGQPFRVLDQYVPLHTGETALYRAIREGVPIVDAAIWKLARLCGGVGVRCGDRKAQAGLEEFFRTVDTGWGQRGVQSFLDRYLDDLFTCGHALGEIVLAPDGKEVAALLCAEPQYMDLAVGADLSVGYLEQRDLNHCFRILETAALRIKRPDAIVVFE